MFYILFSSLWYSIECNVFDIRPRSRQQPPSRHGWSERHCQDWIRSVKPDHKTTWGFQNTGAPPPPPHLYKCTSIYASFFFSRTGQIMLYLNHTPSHLINAPLMFGFSHVCPHILFSCTRTMTAFQHRGFIELLFIFTHLCQPPSDHE